MHNREVVTLGFHHKGLIKRETFPWNAIAIECLWYYLIIFPAWARVKESQICHSLPAAFMVRRRSIPCWSMSGWILHCNEQLSRTSEMSHKTLLYGSSPQSVWTKKEPFQNVTMMSSWNVKSFCFTGPVILMFFLLIPWTYSWTEVARDTFWWSWEL